MRERSSIVVVCGTHAEAHKLAPVVICLREKGIAVCLVVTGQIPSLAQDIRADGKLSPDIELTLQSADFSHAQMLASMIGPLTRVFEARQPGLVLVQGDSVSALSAAMAAAYARIPVAHIEAGLRTNGLDQPSAEEIQRRMLTSIAALHFAPTSHAANQLDREGVAASAVHVTGNTGIDSLFETLRNLNSDPATASRMHNRFPFVAAARRPLLLAALHGRENPMQAIDSAFAALARLAGFFEMEVIVPLYRDSQIRCRAEARLGMLKGVHLIEPADHPEMIWLMQNVRLLLTDSAWLQEEAPSLGLRTLVLKGATERPEAIQAGAAELVDLSADAIVRLTRVALRLPPIAPIHPFGDGKASARISTLIEQFLDYRSNQPFSSLESPGVTS